MTAHWPSVVRSEVGSISSSPTVIYWNSAGLCVLTGYGFGSGGMHLSLDSFLQPLFILLLRWSPFSLLPSAWDINLLLLSLFHSALSCYVLVVQCAKVAKLPWLSCVPSMLAVPGPTAAMQAIKQHASFAPKVYNTNSS